MNLREGEDYYVERGLFVFTAVYLRRRGYCCGSGCRHCPYWPPHAGGSELAPDGLDAASRPNPVADAPASPFPRREGGAQSNRG